MLQRKAKQFLLRSTLKAIRRMKTEKELKDTANFAMGKNNGRDMTHLYDSNGKLGDTYKYP